MVFSREMPGIPRRQQNFLAASRGLYGGEDLGSNQGALPFTFRKE
jgi:hypothetical protein